MRRRSGGTDRRAGGTGRTGTASCSRSGSGLRGLVACHMNPTRWVGGWVGGWVGPAPWQPCVACCALQCIAVQCSAVQTREDQVAGVCRPGAGTAGTPACTACMCFFVARCFVPWWCGSAVAVLPCHPAVVDLTSHAMLCCPTLCRAVLCLRVRSCLVCQRTTCLSCGTKSKATRWVEVGGSGGVVVVVVCVGWWGASPVGADCLLPACCLPVAYLLTAC